MLLSTSLSLALSLAADPVLATDPVPAPQPVAVVQPAVKKTGVVIDAAKILCCELEGRQVVNNGRVLIVEDQIVAVGSRSEIEIPEGFEHVDYGNNWLMPGMVDLHCHVGGTFDINDMVYQANPGLRAKTAVIPGNDSLKRALASGVTSVLFIPGSGTNVGGQGLLFKTAQDRYEDAIIRDPGGLKIAQWGNPERWTIGVGKTFHNYTIREILRRGKAYHQRRKANPDGLPDPQLEVFETLFDLDAQIAVHTQVHQVVLSTIQIIKIEMGLDVFIDHGTFDGWRAGAVAWKHGVNAILGPRNQTAPGRFLGWVGDNPERMQGVAAGYHDMGHRMIGFNTDSPVIPQEELQLQAAMGARFGLPDNNLETVRGLTVVPAATVGMTGKIGSIQPGADADIVVISGHPADPRSAVQAVYVDGAKHYDAEERRLW
ncbi:MAG: amidohydrolase family protein [Planctomycetota bacterium]|jgi:imidazolonepropionase-like amidohydrolase